jgi:hypothetical protein
MAKKNRPTPARNATCDKCNMQGHTIIGSRHRRCGGSEGAPLKDKDKKPQIADRGIWQA